MSKSDSPQPDSPKPILAAGTIVLNNGQVMLVHRPRYDDWSFPKGKVDGNEIFPVTAVRECDEETGFSVALGPYLSVDKYPIPEGEKHVHYWVARVREDIGFAPDEEVDEVLWLSIKAAHKKMTYQQDRELLDRAVLVPETTPLIILRHAKAMKRSDYKGTKDSDALRPLSGKGRRQSKVLIDALDAYGIETLVSSPFVRCRESLQRYAKYIDTKIEISEPLSESGHESDPDATAEVIRDFLRHPEPTVICSHRPVMGTIQETLAHALGIELDYKLAPGAFVVIHRQFGPDGSVAAVNIEQHDVQTT